jgi:hypothetical protein
LVVSPASDQPIGSCWDRLLLGSALADSEHGELSELTLPAAKFGCLSGEL